MHLWLIKTHLEAPVEGSMLLAGILLKLGTYGIIRFSSMWMSTLLTHMNMIFLPFTMVGALMISLNCLFSQDYKLLVACSSIVHMNLVFFSCLQMEECAITTSIMMMISHGLTSSGLFNISNLMYNTISSRSFFMAKSLMASSPFMAMWLLLLIASNVAVPPTMNLSTELQTMKIIVMMSKWFLMVLVMFCFVAGLYSLFYYYAVMNGNMTIFTMKKEMNLMHHTLYFMHLSPLFLFLTWTNTLF